MKSEDIMNKRTMGDLMALKESCEHTALQLMVSHSQWDLIEIWRRVEEANASFPQNCALQLAL